MSKPRPLFARVTRLTPSGSTLTRAGGRPVAVGAEVSDGEAVVLATPGGVGGAVTLDRRGVALRITTVALPAPPMASVVAIITDATPGVVAKDAPSSAILAVPSRIEPATQPPAAVKPAPVPSTGKASRGEAVAPSPPQGDDKR